MIVQFSLIPLGKEGASISEILAKAFQPIIDSGLPYKISSMGTAIEGEWSEIFSVINACRKILHKHTDRVYITISVDDRKNAKNRITGKVQSLEKKIGRKLAN